MQKVINFTDAVIYYPGEGDTKVLLCDGRVLGCLPEHAATQMGPAGLPYVPWPSYNFPQDGAFHVPDDTLAVIVTKDVAHAFTMLHADAQALTKKSLFGRDDVDIFIPDAFQKRGNIRITLRFALI